jgi:hypothetical protein
LLPIGGTSKDIMYIFTGCYIISNLSAFFLISKYLRSIA